MKEAYFTADSIASQAMEMRNKLNTRRGPMERFAPARSALLALDVQRYFLDEESHAHIPSAGAILPGIVKLAQAYAALGLPVIYTQHVNTTQDAGQMADWWRELITADSPLSGLSSELDTSNGVVLPKSQYDAFHQTGLADLLESKDVSQVVVTGVMTHLCCETTARAAFVRGYKVFFTVDGTATYNEAFHLATLTNLAHGFGAPVLVDEVLAALEGNDGD